MVLIGGTAGIGFDLDRAQRDVDAHLWPPMRVARAAVDTVRPGGTLLLVGGRVAAAGASA